MGKHEMFWEPNFMLFYLCNIFYRIVERFSFICECKLCWPKHVKTSCIFVWIIFIYLFVLEFILSTSKRPMTQQHA